jgi:hypothetical protein
LIGGALIARRNLRLGRTDRRGAAIVASFVLAVAFVDWVLTTHHVASSEETGLFFQALSVRVLVACICWLIYLAIEPYVRRMWPHALVSWVRLLDGRFSDPLVGRDVLFALLAGIGFELIIQAWPLASRWFGIAAPALDELGPTYLELQKLTALRFAFSNLVDIPVAMFIFSAGYVVSLVLLRLVLRKQWLAIVAFVIVWTSLPSSANPYVALAFSTMLGALFLFIFLRFGFLTVVLTGGVQGLLQLYPTTFDFTRWYAPNTILVLIVLTALTVYGFRVALAGRPILGDAGLGPPRT